MSGPIGALPPALAAEVRRLEGQEVASGPGGYRIVDVAHEGPPHVGVIERRGAALWLVETSASHRLRGKLAIPRIAGPGYKVWVIGPVAADGAITARRLGVLAPPRR